MFYASQHSLDIEFFIEKQCLTREGDLLGDATHNLIDLSTHLTALLQCIGGLTLGKFSFIREVRLAL